jgi:hypothetical protein
MNEFFFSAPQLKRDPLDSGPSMSTNDLVPPAPDSDEVASWRRIGEQVEARLAAMGVPPCKWLDAQHDLTMAAFRQHAQTCASCAARDQIAGEYEDRSESATLPELRDLSLGAATLVFAGTLALGMGAVALLSWAWGVPPLRAIPVIGGVILIAASVGKPWWFSETIRYLPPLTSIRSDPLARVLLAGFGVACCVVGFMGWLR